MRIQEIPRLMFEEVCEIAKQSPQKIKLAGKEWEIVVIGKSMVIGFWDGEPDTGRRFGHLSLWEFYQNKEADIEKIGDGGPEELGKRDSLLSIVVGPFPTGVCDTKKGRQLQESVMVRC